MQWWKDIVVYQVYPKSFKDSNHDGIGDIKGVIEKLDYIKDLGVNAIWINPVYCSPMADNGYDISDFENIEPQYGTMGDMEELILEAKKRDIQIVMDLVLNHSSDKHQWFQESRSSRESSKRDWYIWKEPKDDGSAPNNWRSKFGGSAWEFDEKTGQYYLHTFAKQQPDLNWENQELRFALYKMITFWMEKGIGGFRLDAITFIKKRPDFAALPADSSDGLVNIDRAALNQDGILDFLHELKENTFDKFDIFTVAEAPGVSTEDLNKYVGDNGVFNMLFEFGHVDIEIGEEGKWYQPKDWSLVDLKKVISESQYVVNRSGWSALYLENHDLPRSINKFLGLDEHPLAAKMLATLYFCLRGTPFIFQGQELGMSNVSFPTIEDYDDIASIDQYHSAIREGYSEEEALRVIWRRSRDNSRTPMQWDTSVNGGFSDHEPWLGINPNYKVINAAQALGNSNSIHNYYQKLISLRKNNKALIHGLYELLAINDEKVWVYTRTLGQEKILVILNFTNENVSFKKPDVFQRSNVQNILISNYEESEHDSKEQFSLNPYEVRVYAF